MAATAPDSDTCYFCYGPRRNNFMANQKPACHQCYLDYDEKKRQLMRGGH